MLLPSWWLLAAVASAQTVDPLSPDTLVLPDGTEVEGMSFLYNWTSSAAASSLRWPTCQPTASSMQGPTAITLHEVGSINPSYGDASGKNRCIHFYVQRDGTILQLAPLDVTWGHAPNYAHAIGIEIANGEGGINFATSAGSDRLAVDWSGARYVYWMTAPQLDNLYTLIDALTKVDFDGDGTPDIPRAVANAALVDGYFLLSSQGTKVSPAADTFLGAYPGLVSHSIYALATETTAPGERPRTWVNAQLRNDGAAAALYLHYRFLGLNASVARCLTQQKAREPRVTTPSIFAGIGIAPEDVALQTWKQFALNEVEEGGSCTGEVEIPIPARPN